MSDTEAMLNDIMNESNNGVDSVDSVDSVLRDLPDATEFPVDAMPDECQVLIREAAAAIGCPAEFVGAPMLAVLGSAIGNSRRIKIKEGWDEPPVFYVGIIGDPGDKKSPAVSIA